MGNSELYTDFFGLKERPFSLTPDPSFLFWSTQHKNAFAVLEFGIFSRSPITLITGEVGSGKTTLLHHLLANIGDDTTIGLVSNAQGGRGELLQWILDALSVPANAAAGYVSNFRRLQDFVVQEYAEGRRVVLIFDEAQNLSQEGLEELRMLTNMNSNKDELLQLVLVGQPELLDQIKSPGMRQLAQRVTASFHLREMDVKEVRHYISHRMHAAGGSGREFSPNACKLIFEASGGVPRLVNQLCEFSLVYAWSNEKRAIDVGTVRKVLQEGVSFAVHAASQHRPVQFHRKNGA